MAIVSLSRKIQYFKPADKMFWHLMGCLQTQRLLERFTKKTRENQKEPRPKFMIACNHETIS